MDEAQFKETYINKPLEVYDIFKEYYGEERVDIQGLPKYISNCEDYSNLLNIFILVYFPEVTVTNENDRSTVINDLYVKICINEKGRLKNKFLFNRATYSTQEWGNNYMHSHAYSIYKSNPDIFSEVCTGSGPINATMSTLRTSSKKDIWELFCLELDRFTQVESLSGGPYHRLENLGNNTKTINLGTYTINIEPTIQECFNSFNLNSSINLNYFLNYLFKSNVIKFAFKYNSYCLGMSEKDFIIKVSNCFIEWYNKNEFYNIHNTDYLISHNILLQCKINDKGKLVGKDSRTAINSRHPISRKVCTFKGKDVLLNIYVSKNNENFILILNTEFLSILLLRILQLINFGYGKGQSKSQYNLNVEF